MATTATGRTGEDAEGESKLVFGLLFFLIYLFYYIFLFFFSPFDDGCNHTTSQQYIYIYIYNIYIY